MKQEVVWGEFRVVAKPLPAHSAGFGGWTHTGDILSGGPVRCNSKWCKVQASRGAVLASKMFDCFAIDDSIGSVPNEQTQQGKRKPTAKATPSLGLLVS